MPEVTVNVRDDIPDALRDSLIAQLEGRPNTVVGNLADLQRLGAATIANEGPNETFRLNPAIDDVDNAKAGAQRALDEEEEAKTAPPPPAAGAEEPIEQKDPGVVVAARRAGEELASVTATTGTTDTADGGRRGRRSES